VGWQVLDGLVQTFLSRLPRPAARRFGVAATAFSASTARIWIRAVALLAITLAADARAGGTERWLVDPGASEAEFRARVFAVITIVGRFNRVAGQIDVDRERGVARVDTAVDLGSLGMPNPAHADWALSPAFFDAERHPEARFRADDVPIAVFAAGGVLHGQLSLRGVRRPVAFRLTPRDCALDPARPCALVLEGSVRRTEFGMHAERHAVADRVQLRITVLGRAESAPPELAAHR
jgi:polyisoprenoid-binding protein YceI